MTFTCTGVDVAIGLAWIINDSSLLTFTFLNTGDEKYPEVVFDMDGITVTIINASFSPPSTHNIESTLTGDVSHLHNSAISCRVVSITSLSYLVRLRGNYWLLLIAIINVVMKRLVSNWIVCYSSV